MSNIFLKSDLDGIFNSTTESNIALPKWINVVDIAANQTNSATSSASVQLGGKFSATSDISSVKDVNKLISMLTSDSSSIKLNQASETTTASLENQLREILEKEGGGKNGRSKSQKGGNDDIQNVKNFFTTLKAQGVNVDIKLNNKTMSEFFGGAESTTTEIPIQGNFIGSETSSYMPNMKSESATSSYMPNMKSESATSSYMPNMKSESVTSSYVPQNISVSETSSIQNSLVGGAKKGKKSSKKSSKKMDGGVNPGFQAFLDLKKHVATKLGISNGPQAAKVAGAVQKEMKEKFPELNAVKIAEEGRKHFDKNVDHFKQMLN